MLQTMTFPAFSKKEWFGIIVLTVLFFAVSVWSTHNGEALGLLLGEQGNIFGIGLYLLLTIGAVVVAPVSTFPLLPIAVSLWGPFFAAMLSVIGWTLGSMIAFLLARRFGRPIVSRFANMEELERFANLMPQEHVFLTLTVLRFAVPVDVFSYAVGLFVPVSFGVFTLSTFIGVSPFAFIFSYAVTQSIWYQVAAVVFALLVVWVTYGKLVHRMRIMPKQ